MWPRAQLRPSPMSDQLLYDGLAGAIRARKSQSSDLLAGSDAATVSAGLAVYRNNVRASLSKALAETFPVVHALVGDDFFKFTAREYFNAHPPSSPLLARYGDAFPRFLETFAPAAATPYLPEMARFESAWLNAYRTRDAQPLGKEAILAEAGGDPSTLRLTLHPSLQLLAFEYPVASIWRRHQHETANIPVTMSEREHIVIIRPRHTVDVHTVSPGAYAAITSLARGLSIGDAFAAACDNDERFDPQEAFHTIFATEIVTAAKRE